MWRKAVVVMTLAVVSAGCTTMSAEDRRAADEEKCRSYGFLKKNDAFAECLQRIDLERRAELRNTPALDPWDRPVIYRPIILKAPPR